MKEDTINKDSKEYSKEYSESSLFDKILKVAKKAGINVIYAALILFYTLQKATTPGWAKTAIIGALGYFISPLDVIPDLTPIAGYSDDLGVLALALATVAMFIDDEVKNKAKDKLRDWFGDYDDALLREVDEKIESNRK